MKTRVSGSKLFAHSGNARASTDVKVAPGGLTEDKMRRIIIAFAATFSVAALSATVASAAESSKFCLKGPGLTDNCTYQTMAACEKAKKGTESCVANPSSTTGSGTTSTTPMK